MQSSALVFSLYLKKFHNTKPNRSLTSWKLKSCNKNKENFTIIQKCSILVLQLSMQIIMTKMHIMRMAHIHEITLKIKQ